MRFFDWQDGVLSKLALKIAITSSAFGFYKDLESLCKKNNISIQRNETKKRFSQNELINFLDDEVCGCICGLEEFDKEIFSRFPNLRYLSRIGVGIDTINQTDANNFNVKILNTPDAPSYAVSEMTVGMVLNISRKISLHCSEMQQKKWRKYTTEGIEDKTIFIIGFGRIGKKTANLLKNFKCNIIVNDPYTTNIQEFKQSSLEEGIKSADIIIIHVNGRDQVLSEKLLFKTKKNVAILNPSRSQNIPENLISKFLKKRKDASFWSDVFDNEPYSGELLNFESFYGTPHVASNTSASRVKMEMEAFENLLKEMIK